MGKSLLKSTAWYTIGNLFIRSVSFLLLPLYSNLISREDFGIYSLIMSLYALASVFYQFGLQSALSKFYLEEKDEAKRKIIFSNVISLIIFLGFILTLIFVSFSENISRVIVESEKYSNLFKLIFTALYFETVVFFLLHLLKTNELSKKVVLVSGAGAVINLILNIYFIYFLQMSIEGIILAQLFSAAVMIVLLLPVMIKNFTFSLDKRLIKKVVLFSLPLILAGLLSVGVDVIDRFILDHFFGKEEVGIYSFAYKIALIMNVFVISFRTAWIPHSLNLFYEDNYKKNFGGTFIKLLALSGFLLISVSLLAGDLFRIEISGLQIFNSKYEPGIVILPFVMLGYIFSGVTAFFSVYPYVSDKTYHFFSSDALAFAVNLVLNFILIPIYGMIGAAIATTFAFLFSALYLFLVSYKKIEIPYNLSKVVVVIISGIGLLIIGNLFENLLLDLLLMAVYLAVIQFIVKIKIQDIIRLTY